VADVLPDQALVDSVVGILHGKPGTVADYHQTSPSRCLVGVGNQVPSMLGEALAAAFLALSDALELVLGESPSRHGQCLKW